MKNMTEMHINEELYREIAVEDEDSSVSSVDWMTDPFNPSKITITRQSPTISNLVDMMKQTPSEIDMNTEFQRSGDLWNPKKQSKLIESILVKFPLPAFYFDAESESRWLIVDGLQRLCCVNNFVVKEELKLTGLEFLTHLEGKRYSELERPLQRVIDQTQVIAYVINPGTPPLVKYNIFKRINTGGLVLEPQEIRHALHQGRPAKFIAELAGLSSFKNATQSKIPPNRMLDREFVNRFAAFYITPPSAYRPDLDAFLNDAMKKIGEMTSEERMSMLGAFDAAMKTAHDIFGDWAFRKADMYPERRKPINKSIFEVWAVELAKLSKEQRAMLRSQKKHILSAFADLCKNDDSFVESISQSTSDKSRVTERFEKVHRLIHGQFGAVK